jgi:hypothetical protein
MNRKNEVTDSINFIIHCTLEHKIFLYMSTKKQMLSNERQTTQKVD